MDKPWKTEISPNYSTARDVQKIILDDMEHLGFDSQSAFAVKLAIEETLIAAIKKSRFDPKKKIYVTVNASPAEYEIGIGDDPWQLSMLRFKMP